MSILLIVASAVSLSLVFGPSIYIGMALGMVIDRMLIVPLARALAHDDRR